MKKNTVLRILTIALAILALATTAADDVRIFTASLSGAAEIPGPGDPDGSGAATIMLNFVQGEVCWDIQVKGITLPASAAHIHQIDPATGFGGVVVTLSAPDAKGHASGCTSASLELIKAIIKNPEGYYVNVHNSDYPAGALRGDLSKVVTPPGKK